MPQGNQAIICPRCEVPMNRHAEKPEYTGSEVSPGDTEDLEAMADPMLGVAVVEVHTCPECGDTVSRRTRPGLGAEAGRG